MSTLTHDLRSADVARLPIGRHPHGDTVTVDLTGGIYVTSQPRSRVRDVMATVAVTALAADIDTFSIDVQMAGTTLIDLARSLRAVISSLTDASATLEGALEGISARREAIAHHGVTTTWRQLPASQRARATLLMVSDAADLAAFGPHTTTGGGESAAAALRHIALQGPAAGAYLAVSDVTPNLPGAMQGLRQLTQAGGGRPGVGLIRDGHGTVLAVELHPFPGRPTSARGFGELRCLHGVW